MSTLVGPEVEKERVEAAFLRSALNDLRAVDASKCTGCRLCELVCSLAHYGAVNPRKARIRVERRGASESLGVCTHCEDRPCIEACLKGAIKADGDELYVDYGRCDRCGECVPACPSGGIRISCGMIMICDLCHGDPQCVKYCVTGALALKKRG